MYRSLNKGEWSEIYVACSLVFSGDLNIKNDGSYSIESISSVNGSYSVLLNGKDDVTIKLKTSGLTMKRSEFGQAAQAILNGIKSGAGGRRSFPIPEVEEFLKTSKILGIRPGSGSRSDISVSARNMYNGSSEKMTFSIKSLIGGRPTLLNVSEKSGINFKIVGDMDEALEESVNSPGGVKNRISFLRKNGLRLEYSEYRSKTFRNNLHMVDSRFPMIFAYSVAVYYSVQGSSLDSIIDALNDPQNRGTEVCSVRDFSNFPVRYKFSELLMHAASGMTTTTAWNGEYDVSGGYIIVGGSGEIYCFPQNRLQEMKDFLLKNSCMDTPSTERHKFGYVYKSGNDYFITLMAQIRICIVKSQDRGTSRT